MSLLGLNDAADDKLFIRYMPSTNGWFVGKDDEVDLKYFILNPTSVKTGWGKITKGEAPDWHWMKPLAKEPSDQVTRKKKRWITSVVSLWICLPKRKG